MDVVRAGDTLAAMEQIAAALDRMRRETGRYASDLQELVDLAYLDPVRLDDIVTQATEVPRMRDEMGDPRFFPVGALVDAWGNAWIYEASGSSYTLMSTASDGSLGPHPGSSYPPQSGSDVDLIMVDGDLVRQPVLR